MSVLTPGTTFANGEQLTASDLNLLLQGATFTQSSVDNQSTQLVGTAIVVADGGIIAAKLAADAVTTSKIKDANVTTAKIADANVTTAKIADANVTFAKLTDVIDDDTMATATDTTLATSESIKAYVDVTLASSSSFTTEDGQSAGYQVFPSGLKMAWGDSTAGQNGVITFPSGVGFTVAPTVQISYNKATNSGTYYGAQVGDVSTTNFVYHGTYANLYGPRYLAIGN